MKVLLTLLITSIYLFGVDAFISAADLAKIIDNKTTVILDTTDEATFKKEHIKNAIRVDITDFRYKVDDTYQLMHPANNIQEVMKKLGINNNSHVIIYGHNKGKELLKSSYVALSLIVNGMNKVSLLNGGFAEFEYDYSDLITTKIKEPKRGNFVGLYNKNILVDMNYVMQKIGKTTMIEARPFDYYSGEKQSKGIKRLGHIKGAKSSYWRDKINSDDTIKSDQELLKIFSKGLKLDKQEEIIAYCTGGLEASMNWYILHHHLKYKDVKIYDASMRQWGNLDNTPMELTH